MDANRSLGRLAELTPYDCWSLLEDVEVGRVAWCTIDGPAVVPVNVTVADGALWFRTAPYSTLVNHCRGGRVAVEIDNLDPTRRAGWSVVVTGIAEIVDGDEVPGGVHLLDTWAPGSRTAHVRVETQQVTGRRLTPPAP
ncbi:pyridoxamine 5'-phosphate oxidase family protein [Nocardioides sp. cx-173]|uniref:pyridoxamine 5'-phosphate oxidase family protein n=1 Tax=Nocardioides sp. cx-173 TaxID=2898796 RepID=UPI001E43F3EF|nr:pyridoxamine 5'-phosphate oxidase family protein [Nocardioides sp. cx-173]MCD4525787.1 pyridoxamine 5'-phosphate oxidase family protein [Nocardioides sp. cx-173]UGB39944.1 pyridoxamine 5'-phosphate oxidase family protein [Nocardioides sp. cx-173]